MLAAMFSGRHDDRMDRDKDGNVFLDYSAAVITSLIEFLRLRRDEPDRNEVLRALPGPPGHADSFDSMVRFFGLSYYATFKFNGIQENLPIEDLHGWQMIFSETYNHKTRLADFEPPSHLAGGSLLVGARRTGSKTLALAAMGNSEVVTSRTRDDATNLHNDVYWYCNPSKSIGFAPQSHVTLGCADTTDQRCTKRLSWNLMHTGGWRAGAACTLYDSSEWEKVIFASPVKLFA